MTNEAQKALGFLLATGALVLTVLVLGPRLLGFASGPENEIILSLKKLERSGAEVTIGGRALRGPTLRFQRLSVTLEPTGDRALAVGTLDFTGDYARTTKVSSVGLEQVPFVKRDGFWEPLAGPFPRLEAIVRALEARRAEIEQGQALDGGLAEPMVRRRYQARAWYIRSDRELVQVSEDYRLTGESSARPVDEEGTVRLDLKEGPHGTFVFASGMQ